MDIRFPEVSLISDMFILQDDIVYDLAARQQYFLAILAVVCHCCDFMVLCVF